MKITKVETIRLAEFGNLIWVRIYTDEGLVGLGETFMGAAAVEAYIHETAAQKLVGQNPLHIEARMLGLQTYLGWRSTGVERRGNSAINIALWDIFAKAAGMPLVDALGGRARDSIRTYNTCAGYKYIRDTRSQAVANWHVGETGGPYEDLEGFLYRTDELAHSLLEQGITAMKIWPFDIAAERTGGYDISPQELDTALEPFRRIRKAVGDKMDIMVEFHSLWSLPMACKLARRLEEFDTYWHEDPFRLDNPGDLLEYRRHSKAWVCASETLAMTHSFRDYLQTGAAVFFPRVMAPGSGAALEWRVSKGVGTVYATTVVHTKGEAPHNVALIDLDEGFRMMSRVEGIDPMEVKIGMRVRVRMHPGEPAYPVFDVEAGV